MNKIKSLIRKVMLISLLLLGGVGGGLLTSCVDSPVPASILLPEQVERMEMAQKGMLSGIVAYVNHFRSWSSSDTYYTQDWGYPCQMFYREVLGSDIPISGGAYNYWINVEKNTVLTAAPTYTYYYYYCFINNCNNLISLIDPATASEESRHYLGCALTFRAMCYLDIARMFEFQPTGISDYDNEAESLGIWGLTVPIVSEKTPQDQLNNNPRVPFTTMYRFILNDLNQAENLLAGYERPAGNYPDLSVVYGMQARLWLEMATRFNRSADDLKAQLKLEGNGDGYADLLVSTVEDCYEKAANYAHKAQAGYSPMTQEEWTNPTTGFNTATNSWMLFSRVSTQEQEGNYFSSLLGTVCTEASWAMPQYGGGNYRCIGDWLYNRISDSDWRKKSWISPDDAGENPDPKYRLVKADKFADYPEYANLKFRTRDYDDLVEGLKCDIPLMRVEEMYFIEAEAVAHTKGAAAGATLLQNFINTYRYTDGSYNCETTLLTDFTRRLMEQKRIEFWGEGICYFDYKRLRMQVRRSDNSNYPEDMQHDSKEGYVCPSMNYYILNNEINNNPAVKRNPDCSKWYDKINN